MGNIFSSPEKASIKSQLFKAGLMALEAQGWAVERVPKVGKSSIRRIVRGGESKIATIRTTQDTYIAFPRDSADKEWLTLSMADLVVAVSVDDPANPHFAQVHLIDGDEMRDRFDRSRDARVKAGHSIQPGQGMWLGLYEKEDSAPPSLVGAGAGLKHPPVARYPLTDGRTDAPVSQPSATAEPTATNDSLSIPEARRRLAATLGISPENVKITIEV